MNKLNYGFFSPLRNDNGNDQENAPQTLSFKECWWRDFHILHGKADSSSQNNDSEALTKLLILDPYFSLVVGISTFYNSNNPNMQALNSNLGILHYFNLFVPLSLASFAISIELKHLGNKLKATNPTLSHACEVIAAINYYIFSIPLMIIGIVSEVIYTLFNALFSAIIATCSAGINYLGNKIHQEPDQAEGSVVEDDTIAPSMSHA